MTSEVEKLRLRLEASGARQFNVFPGDKPCTPEELAAEVNRAMDAIERGDCKIVYDYNYFMEFDSEEQVKHFYKMYPVPFLDS